MFNKKDYTIKEFNKSNRLNKKYVVLLIQKKTGNIYKIHFGDKRYQHYYDKVGLYSHLNHGSKKRRDNFRSRHRHTYDPEVYSPTWFSWRYLW